MERDAARLELNKKLAVHKAKQSQVKQQIEEIDRLNTIINSMEREMLSLKREYEVRRSWDCRVSAKGLQGLEWAG